MNYSTLDEQKAQTTLFNIYSECFQGFFRYVTHSKCSVISLKNSADLASNMNLKCTEDFCEDLYCYNYIS